jgi:ABC-type dipeptide/oligopeptide/nickel transport system permease subunit
VVAEAGLSFLGVGLQAPTISWGQMLGTAEQRISDLPYLLLFPGVFLSLTVLAFLMAGDVLRRHLDPDSAP